MEQSGHLSCISSIVTASVSKCGQVTSPQWLRLQHGDHKLKASNTVIQGDGSYFSKKYEEATADSLPIMEFLPDFLDRQR